MYQNQVRNIQLRDFLLNRECSRSLLPSIYEERCQYNVPDINLECEESIDNWDDLELEIYSPERNEKVLDTNISENLADVQDILKNEVANYDSDEDRGPVLLLESHLVQSLLEKYKNSNDNCLPLLDNGAADTTKSLELFDKNELSLQIDVNCANENVSKNDSIGSISMLPRNSEMLQSLPIYDSSPRSSSPSFVEILSNADYDFTNYRSVSPLIVRSPTPLSSRSSSPRMFRSPSPLEFLEHSFSELPIDEATDIMFYNDGNFRRSFSPVLFGSTDQQVPDANTDLQQVVMSSAEFPSFQNYVHNRRLNSCQDQVVPEFIEE
ncbi:hypothetical protein ACF0H5_003241 [Mactra antiquata]